jgi:GT2 family glycosyltransferase
MPRRAIGDSRPPKVSVMILNYNGLRWLPPCLTSVLKSTYPDYDVYFIDNGSTDGSVEFVRKRFPEVRVVAHTANLGFPEAYNRQISEVACEYVVLLNNDTQVLDEDWLEHLVRAASRDNTVAAVACKIVSMRDNRLLDSVGGMGIRFWRGFVDIGKGEPDRGQYQGSFEPFAFCGGAALIKRSAFSAVGGFDSRFFLYFEDSDISWKFRLIGRSIAFAPGARVAHFFSGSFGGVDVDRFKLYYCHRNYLCSILENCGSSVRWALRNYFLFTFFLLLGFAIFEPRKAVAVLKGLAWNFRHLRRTYAERKRVQGRRRVSDQALLKVMYPRLRRHQVDGHARLRRIIDTLFSRTFAARDMLNHIS